MQNGGSSRHDHAQPDKLDGTPGMEPLPDTAAQLSTEGKMEGMKGPTWKDLVGSELELENGKKLTADAA